MELPIPDAPHEYVSPPEWVSVHECRSPLVARRMFGKTVPKQPTDAPAWVADQPEG